MDFHRFSPASSKVHAVAIAVVSLLLFSFLDYLVFPEISFRPFYLIPVSVAAWYLGRVPGIVFSVAGVAMWFAVELHSNTKLYSGPLIRFWDALVLLGFYVFSSLILSSLRQAMERTRELSRVDFLTGVLNSRAFQDLAEMEKNRARRYRHPLTLAYLDIDNFKQINDRFGHNAGDLVLSTVARAMRQEVRDTDIVARVGGDEFALLLPETGPEASQVVLEKLRESLQEMMNHLPWAVTFSIGAVTFVGEPESLQQMIANADRLMYAAKQGGKNRIAHSVIGRQIAD